MKKYLLVFKLASQDIFQYKLDFFLSVLKYSVMVFLMTIVWLNVEKSGGVGVFTPQQTVGYFIFSAMLYSLSNFHPWYIEEDIRLGYLSKYLVKPVSPTIYYFCFELTRVSIETVSKMIVFFGILFWLNLLPNLSFWQVGILLLYSPFIFLFAFQWLMIISLLSFWVTEAYALRWAVTLFTRFMSGVLVPMVYMPEQIQRIFFFLPFEHLAFTPISFMLGNSSLTMLGQGFGILLIWTLVITLVRQWTWKKGLHSYEGTGI